MPRVIIYTTNYCPFCFWAKAMLDSKNVEMDEIDVTYKSELREEMQRLSGRKTIPQIFIDGKSIGGFDELRNLDSAGELDRLLEKSPEAD